MSDKTHETSISPELISEICKAEKLYCDGKSAECNAAYQALFDRFTKPKEQIQIIQHWNECLIHDEYLKKENSAIHSLKFECLYANIKSAVGDFQISADALDKAALISRQCRFTAAGFPIASSKAFAAYCRLDMECFEKYESIALGYSGWGVDSHGFSVRWLKQL